MICKDKIEKWLYENTDGGFYAHALNDDELAEVILDCLQDIGPKWISVDDAKPNNFSWVMITALGGSGSIVTMAFYELSSHGEEFWLSGADHDKDGWEDVTHWMPLPEPPND